MMKVTVARHAVLGGKLVLPRGVGFLPEIRRSLAPVAFALRRERATKQRSAARRAADFLRRLAQAVAERSKAPPLAATLRVIAPRRDDGGCANLLPRQLFQIAKFSDLALSWSGAIRRNARCARGSLRHGGLRRLRRVDWLSGHSAAGVALFPAGAR
jgi:hypothetical protein